MPLLLRFHPSNLTSVFSISHPFTVKYMPKKVFACCHTRTIPLYRNTSKSMLYVCVVWLNYWVPGFTHSLAQQYGRISVPPFLKKTFPVLIICNFEFLCITTRRSMNYVDCRLEISKSFYCVLVVFWAVSSTQGCILIYPRHSVNAV